MDTIRTFAIFSVAALASLSMADIVDLSGLESWGIEGDPGNGSRVYQLTDPGPIDGFGYIILRIDYDITIETFGTSWFSDLTIRFGNSDGTFHGNWPDTFTPGAGADFGGIQRFTGSFDTDIHLNEDGEFHVELFETFDDTSGAIDAALLSGSTMSIGIFVPAPGGVSLLAVGGVTLATRRRR